MKKHLLKSLLLIAALVMGAGSAWAGDKTVVSYSFDDVNSPAVTAGSRVSLDYTRTSVITSTAFLNAWNSTNGDPGASTISLGSTDLSAETWTLSFEWAAVGGCNSKIDHTTLKAGDTNLFDLSGNSNWNQTVTLSVAGSATATTLPVPGCDKSKRFTANTGDQMNTTAYWHHIVVTGSSDGVKLTITNSSTGNAIVTDMVLSETNVNPTSLIIEPCCGGAIGIDELSLSYFVEGEVIQTPMAAYTAVNGINRTITATCATEGATLYYSTDGENWTEGASVTVSESGNVYFKAVKGNSESDVLTFAAEAGTEIVLNAPTIARNANGTVTISADQSKLLLAPTATIYYTYGEENGSFTGSKELTVAADATITAYAEAEGYAKSADATRAVALFPEDVNTLFSVAAATNGWSANAFNAETITASERTYATLLLDDAAWSENVLLQTNGAWGLRASGNWYINSNTDNSWLLVKDTKAGNIIVVDATFAPAETVNATYTEKYSFGTKHAYTITADGNAEFALIKPAATEMDYFYGVYGYSVMSDAETESELMTEARDLAADADAVAVGKLLAAIATAKESGDESGLQAAIDQFKADNADQEKDETAKVATNGWKKFTGNDAAGICATQYAPAIDTYDGRKNVQLAENYESTVQTTGTIIYQDITGLTNGKYKVGFYGNAFYTSGRGFESTMEDGATDVAYVFANDQKEFITARIATSTTENNFRQFDVEVTDGTIKLGMGKEKPGTNWHTMQIYQLTWFTTAKEVFAADQEQLKALIAEANTLLADETKTEGRGLFKGLVAAAELCVDSKMMNITELENVIGNLKDGIAEFKQANYTTFDGKYYVQNVASGKFMAAGHNYGTRGIVDGTGLDMTLKANENKTVDFDSQVFQSNSQHFLGSNLYMDSDSWGWIIEKVGEDVYTISNGTQYIGVDAEDNLVLQDDAATWKFLGAEAVEAARLEAGMTALASATAENGVDATFLLKDANFNRNDHRWDAWKVEFISGNNKNLGGGCNGTNGNGNAESYHAAFNISQTIANAPAGVYALTAQGFYRQDDGATEAAPVFYIGDATAEVPVKTGEESSMTDASISFTEGKYTIEPISYTLAEDGALTVGIKNGENVHQWVIFDNFRLTYYGPAHTKYTVNVAPTENGDVVVDKTEAAEGEQVTVTVTPSEGYKVDEAYYTYNETKVNFEKPQEGNSVTFTMPAAAVTITVTFKQNQVTPQPAENILYSWESPEGTPIETGGTIEHLYGKTNRLNYQNGTYYTICLNGKKDNVKDTAVDESKDTASRMLITLDNAVSAGDTIAYTAYVNKNESKKASPYILFENGEAAEGEVFSDEANIDATFNGVPTLKYTLVPEAAAGSKTITLTRSQTGTNLFITKLQIIKNTDTTGISTMNADAQAQGIYNMRGQKVEKAVKGLYIINGKKVVIK